MLRAQTRGTRGTGRPPPLTPPKGGGGAALAASTCTLLPPTAPRNLAETCGGAERGRAGQSGRVGWETPYPALALHCRVLPDQQRAAEKGWDYQ